MSKLTRDKLLVFQRLQSFKKMKGGKEVYDYEAARGGHYAHRSRAIRREPDELIQAVCERRSWGAYDLAKIVQEVKRWPKGRVLTVIKPKKHPVGAVLAEDVFGNVKLWSKLRREITYLVLKGETLKSNTRRLQRTFHIYSEELSKPGTKQRFRNWLVKEIWKDVEQDHKRYTPMDKRLLLEWEERSRAEERASKAELRSSRKKNDSGARTKPSEEKTAKALEVTRSFRSGKR